MSLKARSVSQVSIKHLPSLCDVQDIGVAEDSCPPAASRDECLHDPTLAQQIQKPPGRLRGNPCVGREMGALEIGYWKIQSRAWIA